MKKSEKRIKPNSRKRLYCKPQMERVQLMTDEAVLTACKQTYFHWTNAWLEDGCYIIVASCVQDGS
jgi:hypothetical protein